MLENLVIVQEGRMLHIAASETWIRDRINDGEGYYVDIMVAHLSPIAKLLLKL